VSAALDKTCRTAAQLIQLALMAKPDLNVVLVSDHGMSSVRKTLDLSGDADFSGCLSANEGPMTRLYCKDSERVYRSLKGKSPDYVVWRRREIPVHLRSRDNPRTGDLLIVPTGPYIVNVVLPDDGSEAVPPLKGMHGYDPETNREMRGILVGYGPLFRPGAIVNQARNEDVFALVCALLDLPQPSGLDARLSRVRGLLRRPPPAAR
jgi:alkaline phosphatase D